MKIVHFADDAAKSVLSKKFKFDSSNETVEESEQSDSATEYNSLAVKRNRGGANTQATTVDYDGLDGKYNFI